MLDKIERKEQNDTVPHPIRKTGDIPEIPRLALLREDILRSNYHLCTQKASLMTAYFKRIRRIGSLRKIITAFHFRQFKKTLERTRRDIPQKKWQVRLGNFLNTLYLKLDRTDERIKEGFYEREAPEREPG